MRKVFIDTNVLIDFWGERDPFVIITRNKKDFRFSSLPVYTPEEYLKI